MEYTLITSMQLVWHYYYNTVLEFMQVFLQKKPNRR